LNGGATMSRLPISHRADPTAQLHDVVALNVPIGRRCCAACAQLVERRLLQHPHVNTAHVDAAEGMAQLQAEAGSVSVEELRQLAGECCGDRSPVPLPDAAVSSHHHAHTARPDSVVDAPEAHAIAGAQHAGFAKQ
jgi:hypothetical protein